MGLVVFSDLDGTLLDHQTYSYEAALPALVEMRRLKTPLVLCSSKTRAEMQPLHRELELNCPFIVENGGGIFALPDRPLAAGEPWQDTGDGWRVLEVGLPINEVRQRFETFKERFKAKGFGDMSDREVAKLTGLSREQAALAKKREFNEPVLLPHPEQQAQDFVAAAQEAGLTAVQGGRFWHLLGGGDKGKAVRLLTVLYAKRELELTTMALGDAPNDLSMLEAVDKPVLVARPDGSHANLELEGLILEPLPGPQGWNRAVLDALAQQEAL